MEIYEDFLSIESFGERNICNSYNMDKDLSKSMSKYIDEIYLKNLGAININRVPEISDIDQKLHIDCIITKKNNTIRTYQEKVLRYRYAHHNTLTIEYYDDWKIKKEGEYFRLCSQYYFSGYANKEENQIIKWIVIDVPRFFDYLDEINYVPKDIKVKYSKASFICFSYKDIPESCIVDKKIV